MNKQQFLQPSNELNSQYSENAISKIKEIEPQKNIIETSQDYSDNEEEYNSLYSSSSFSDDNDNESFEKKIPPAKKETQSEKYSLDDFIRPNWQRLFWKSL